MLPPYCDSCRRVARLTSGAEVYSRGEELRSVRVWVCDGCGSRVGCHKGTTRPLGTLASRELRQARVRAHGLLDQIWQSWRHPDSRKLCYAYLASALNLEISECHIGQFDLDMCERAVATLEATTRGTVEKWRQDRLRPESQEYKNPRKTYIRGRLGVRKSWY